MPLMRDVNVVPFGKYRGQPVEQLAADQEYCQWLIGQSWFVEKFAAIHTLIINNFTEPDETPEHNRLQLRFLDEAFRRQCVHIFMQSDCEAMVHHTALDATHSIVMPNAPEFEVDGWDVCWTVYAGSNYCNFYVECKPMLGDDFPAVLRAMRLAAERSSGKNYRTVYGHAYVLVAENVHSVAGSLVQLKTFFTQSGFALYTVAEIEAVQAI